MGTTLSKETPWSSQVTISDAPPIYSDWSRKAKTAEKPGWTKCACWILEAPAKSVIRSNRDEQSQLAETGHTLNKSAPCSVADRAGFLHPPHRLEVFDALE